MIEASEDITSSLHTSNRPDTPQEVTKVPKTVKCGKCLLDTKGQRKI